MNAQLQQLGTEFRELAERAKTLATRAGERLCERPSPQSWSAGECLEHLRLSTEAYFPVWARSFTEARALGNWSSGAEYHLDLFGKLLKWTLEPPPKFRFRAPSNFHPIDVGRPDQVLPAFLASQDGLLEFIRQADGLPIDKLKVPSPFNSKLRYSVWSSFCVTAAHQRRHLAQAERAVVTGRSGDSASGFKTAVQ